MGTLRDPSTINNVGTLGGATNPTTAQALPLERENQKAIRELVGAFGYEDLTISAGGITPTKAEVTVDTEAGASADDLTTIYLVSDGTTTLHDGMLLKIRAYDPARTVTVKHGSGTNQIQTVSGTDIVLGTTWELTLKLQSGVWKEVQGKPVIDITGNATTATDLASGSVLAIAKGGTGATSAADARTNLAVYSAADVDALILSASATVARVEGLRMSTTGADAQIQLSFDDAVLRSASGAKRFQAATLTLNSAGSGANGLDTGTIAASTWYAIWLIGKADGTIAALLAKPLATVGTVTSGSAVITAIPTTAAMAAGMPVSGPNLPAGTVIKSVDSSTQITISRAAISSGTGVAITAVTDPVMPSGYTYKVRSKAWIFTDATANKYPLGIVHCNGMSQYTGTYRQMAVGVQTYGAVSIASFVPPTSPTISLLCTSGTGGIMYAGTQAGQIIHAANGANAASSFVTHITVSLESSVIYYGGNVATSAIACAGWRE